MFSGIVEGRGCVVGIKRTGELVTLTVEAGRIADGVDVNDSVAVDGVCLTVIAKEGSRLTFDLVPETVTKSTLGPEAEGRFVNLERSLGAMNRIDGHLIQGHVDCMGNIVAIEDLGESLVIDFEVPHRFSNLIVERGSVAIDGISLTVAECSGNQFRAAFIPHTLELTTMGEHKVGDPVNVEFDMIGKYVVKTVEAWKGVTS
ncbi:MAG: riboflavin synthase [Fidelibacterota bacterium]